MVLCTHAGPPPNTTIVKRSLAPHLDMRRVRGLSWAASFQDTQPWRRRSPPRRLDRHVAEAALVTTDVAHAWQLQQVLELREVPDEGLLRVFDAGEGTCPNCHLREERRADRQGVPFLNGS